MPAILPLILLCLFSIFGNSYTQAYQSAHVITVSVDTNQSGKVKKKYVLFGLLHNGKLSTFGGLRDTNETNPKVTAAREMEEEALGVLGKQYKVLKQLKNVNPCFDVNGHICYVLPEQNYGTEISTRFKQIRFNPKKKLSKSQKEMVDIVAVDVDIIRQKVMQQEPLHFEDNEGVLRQVRVEKPIIEAILSGQITSPIMNSIIGKESYHDLSRIK
jgi:hypothetical protein